MLEILKSREPNNKVVPIEHDKFVHNALFLGKKLSSNFWLSNSLMYCIKCVKIICLYTQISLLERIPQCADINQYYQLEFTISLTHFHQLIQGYTRSNSRVINSARSRILTHYSNVIVAAIFSCDISELTKLISSVHNLPFQQLIYQLIVYPYDIRIVIQLEK